MFLDVGSPSVVVFAPRGKGKTQFMMKDMIPAAAAEGMQPVYVNFWTDNTQPAESISKALLSAIGQAVAEQGAQESLGASVLRSLSRISGELGVELEGDIPHVGRGKVAIKVAKAAAAGGGELSRASSSLAHMKELTDILIKTSQKPLLFVFDEVQTLASKPEHETFVRSLRTLLDERKGKVYSIFTGSSQSRLADMFQRIKAPLYCFARNDTLPPLGDDFLQHWLKNIQQIMGNDPSLTLERMRTAFQSTEENPRVFWAAVSDMILGGSTEIERFTRTAVADVQSNAGVIQRLRSLTTLDRIVLTEVVKWELRVEAKEVERADGMSLFSQESRRSMALALGMVPTPQQVQTSIRRLTGKDLQLIVSLDRGNYQIEDPFFLEALADVLVRNTEVVSPSLLELAADEASIRGGTVGPDDSLVDSSVDSAGDEESRGDENRRSMRERP